MPRLSEQVLSDIAPTARSFVRSGVASLEHAYSHTAFSVVDDGMQVTMSAAHSAEMFCKAALLQRGESIYEGSRGTRTISLRDALRALGPRARFVEMDILAGRRDPVQHFASYIERAEALDNLELVRSYVSDLARSVLRLDLDQIAEIPPAAVHVDRADSELTEDGTAIQRDPHFEGGVLVWAQANRGEEGLRVRMRDPGRRDRWLTPEGEFEYMPCTDGRRVACYRQSGGVVVYDLATFNRQVVADMGGPGAISGDSLAVQGLTTPDGLGGGVWLVVLSGGERLISETGDSPLFDDPYIYWQERAGEDLTIRRQLISGGPTETLAVNARHPTVHGGLLAFSEGGVAPRLFGVELDSGKGPLLISESAIFPNVRNGRITFLQEGSDQHDLAVFDWSAEELILTIQDVGFPTGRGPVLTDAEVVWEARTTHGVLLKHHPLQS